MDQIPLRHRNKTLRRGGGDGHLDVGRRGPRGTGAEWNRGRTDRLRSARDLDVSVPDPAAAPQIAHLIGADAPAAFDISAGCAGFCHALNLAADMVRGGSARYVLVIGTERLSETLDLADRSTAFIFADGAGAVVVGPADVEGIGPVVWGSDGSQSDVIRQEPGWSQFRQDPTVGRPFVRMEGTKVFRWAPFAMVKVATEALDRAGITVADLDAFIPHQANLRITETLARGLKLPESVPVAHDIVTAGNTSAASVPLAMEAMLAAGEAPPGGMALLVAFGAGLSYAGQVVTLPPWKASTL